MAQFRQAPIATGLSDFRGNTGDPGSGFRALADILDSAYQTMKPAALQELQRRGTDVGHEFTQDQMQGGTALPVTGGGGDWASAIRSVESSGNYQAKGPVTKSGDRAYGAYQVMGANIGPWTQKHLGRAMTPDEFLADPAAQDAVFKGEFGGYLANGTPQDAISRWFSGRPYAEAVNRSDGYNTTAQYVAKVMGATGQAADPIVMMRDANGALVKKLWSPMSGEFGQVFNAAASTAYLADVMVKGSADLMSLSSQFPLDPQGFQQAATAYANNLVKSAPTPFKADVSAQMQDEIGRRFLGMMSEVQTDTQNRAINSTTALVEKWGTDYAAAVASGDAATIASAKANLDAALRAKESLPGVYWTPEQSANEVAQREAQGVKAAADASTAQSKVYKDQLTTVIAGAEAGGTSAYDGILSDPNVKAAQPDLWAEAMAKRTFANQTPGFMAMTPADQAATVAGLKAQPISDKWQVDIPKAAADLAAKSAAGWKADPIAFAAQVLPNKPPAIVPFNADRPMDFVNSMAARLAYSKAMDAAGYPFKGAVLTGEEATALGVALGKGQDPATRALLAGAIAMAAGKDAVGVFSQIKTDDKTVIHAGKLLASHGDPAVATAMMRGQALIDDGLIQLPPKSDSIAAISGDIGNALAAAPGAFGSEDDILAAAKAYYAATAPRGTDPTSEAAAGYMAKAVQAAMGQTTVYRNRQNLLVGGVQDINGSPTLLPMDVAGVEVTAALEKAAGGVAQTAWTQGQASGAATSLNAPGPDAAIWGKIGGSPTLGGQPLSRDDMESATIFPVRDGVYGLSIIRQGQPVDARDAGGGLYTFDIHKLIEAAQ